MKGESFDHKRIMMAEAIYRSIRLICATVLIVVATNLATQLAYQWSVLRASEEYLKLERSQMQQKSRPRALPGTERL